jgi:hypothetical protein
MGSKVLSETPADKLQCETWLQERIKEQDHDFAVIDRNYLNQLRIHLHLDEKNRVRLILINTSKPIDSFYSVKENSNDVPVEVKTYWLDAWSGPKEIPNPLPKANAELHFKVNLSSCREYSWVNFDGIFLSDLTKLSKNAADSKTKALFHSDVQFVRCIFESGNFNGRIFNLPLLFRTLGPSKSQMNLSWLISRSGLSVAHSSSVIGSLSWEQIIAASLFILLAGFLKK